MVVDINPSVEFFLSVSEDATSVYFSATADSDFVSGARIEIYPSGSPIALADTWEGDDLTFGCFLSKFGPGWSLETGEPLVGLGHDGETYDYGYASATGIMFWGPFSIQPFRVQGVGFPSGTTATVDYLESTPDVGSDLDEENSSPPSIDGDPWLRKPTDFLAILTIDPITSEPKVTLTWTDQSDDEDGYVLAWGSSLTGIGWIELVTLGPNARRYVDTDTVSVTNAINETGYSYRIYAYLNSKRTDYVYGYAKKPDFTVDPASGSISGGITATINFTS